MHQWPREPAACRIKAAAKPLLAKIAATDAKIAGVCGFAGFRKAGRQAGISSQNDGCLARHFSSSSRTTAIVPKYEVRFT
jgi:hypothetical protein